MIFFLYGADDYRRFARKRELISELQKKYPDITAGNFSLKGEGSAFLDFARGQSLFSRKRLAVLDDVFELEAKEASLLVKPFLEDKEVAILISEHSKPLKPLEFLSHKPVLAEQFTKLEPDDFLDFARKLAKKENLNIEPEALKLLADLYAGNSWGLATEIAKLSSLGARVGQKEIEELGLDAPADYWQTLNSLKSQNLGARLWALFRLALSREGAPKTFNMLAATTKTRAESFANYDLLIKSGKLDYEEALLDFALG
ncbi:MAG: hypothetical protein Q7S36_00715 [Candidatus Liptonbacteria bacterium]|nr:hypothetical protein [Candidatus Liptonbacteria bacterium]